MNKVAKSILIAVIASFCISLQSPIVSYAQEGGGNPNPYEVEQILSEVKTKLSAEQLAQVEEMEQKNNQCLRNALIAAGFTYLPDGSLGGSVATFISNLTLCRLN